MAQSKLIRALLGLFALVVALVVTTLPTAAEGRKPKNHDVVTNDGRKVARVQFATEAAAREAALPAKGNGKRLTNPARTDLAGVEEVGPASSPAATENAGTESVIGTDSRYQISSTTSYPYRAIAHITSSIGGCTGWLIGPNTVATAGHCVYGSSGWATNVRVYPGRNGSYAPYGSCTAKWLASVYGWTNGFNRDYDYGVIKLNCSVGNTVGWFGFRWQSASHTGSPSYISGYPGDKAYGTQWRSNDYVRSTTTRRLYYANDTAGGMSGSPVWDNNAGCYPCGVAIHAYGVDGTGYNGGTRIVEPVFNNLLAWRNAQ